MNSVPQVPKRRRLFVVLASVLGIFFLLTLLVAFLPDEPPFDNLKPEDCNNDWFRRQINRDIKGNGVIYELNPAGGSLQEGGVVCMAFPRTDRGVVVLTYGFRWRDKAKRLWEVKFL
jgi:hypothetical protein